MADPFIGEIRAFSFSFAPDSWLLCDGKSYDSRTYAALSAILGFAFGGNPSQNQFNVPNLNGSVVVGAGDGPELQPWTVGQSGGDAVVTLGANEGVRHSHALIGKHDSVGTAGNKGMTGTPSAAVVIDRLFLAPTNALEPFSNPPAVTGLDPNVLSPGYTAMTTPHNNDMPYLPLVYAICYSGEWPYRP